MRWILKDRVPRVPRRWFVYALLPADWLAMSGLKNPSAAVGELISLNRVPPDLVEASFPGYGEADQAQVNFFYTVINEDDPNLGQTSNNTNYFSQGEAEPWLYDRAMAFYVRYLRTGSFRLLREAVRNADYYRQQLFTATDCNDGPCVGSFRLNNPDPANPYPDAKYTYNESLAMTYWLTGDEAALARIRDVPRIYQSTATVPNASFFTERHAGFKWLAIVVAYEVTGDAQYKTALLSILHEFRAAQDNPPAGTPNDGGIWHSIRIHEGDNSDAMITSPWMSALIVDAAMRARLVSDNADLAQLVRRFATHVCDVGSYMTTIRNGENGLADQSNGAPLRFPHYLATPDGLGWSSEFNPYSDFEHAFETGTIAASGRRRSSLPALPGADTAAG